MIVTRVFNYMTKFSFLHYLEFDFSVTCHQKALDNASPLLPAPTVFLGIYFNHCMVRYRNPGKYCHARWPESCKKPGHFISLHGMQKIRVREPLSGSGGVKPRPLPLLPICWGILAEGDFLPLPGLPAPGKSAVQLMSPFRPHSGAQCSGALSAPAAFPHTGAANELCVLLSTGRINCRGPSALSRCEGSLGDGNHCRGDLPRPKKQGCFICWCFRTRVTGSWAQEPRSEDTSEPSSVSAFPNYPGWSPVICLTTNPPNTYSI